MRGFFGVAIYGGTKSGNLGTLLRTANILGANFIAMVGCKYKHQASDTMKTPKHVPVFEYDTWEEFKKAMPKNCKLIAIENYDGAVNLNDFKHPERACYILGSEARGLPQKVIQEVDEMVILNGTHCFNQAVAGSIVMYDRIR